MISILLINVKMPTSTFCSRITWADPQGGQGVRTPLNNHKSIGFLSNTAGPDPLKNQKATKPAFNVGTIGSPAKCRFAGGPMMTHL